ncbi:Protein of uncharacterised function (DUF2786) [Yersinia frederiksenii]|nr:Protein of uncharacterised function (DUF2786) [Yersinia frederiksenii]CNL55796.1 Protein of uncharacterised function (DUF2786) [Yersinia frederiksenii]
MNKEKYLAKIKKLLNLAAKNSSPHEAALALEQAKKLMRQHQLTESDIELMAISEASSKGAPSHAETIPKYMATLISVINIAFGVSSYLSPTRQPPHYHYKNIVKFYGPAERPQVAAYAFDVMSRQLTSARKTFSAGQRKSLKRSTKIACADMFCEAWVKGAYQVIQRFAVTDDEQVLMETYFQKIGGGDFDKGESREAKKVRGSDDAAIAGYISGRNAELNHGVDGTPMAQIGSAS